MLYLSTDIWELIQKLFPLPKKSLVFAPNANAIDTSLSSMENVWTTGIINSNDCLPHDERHDIDYEHYKEATERLRSNNVSITVTDRPEIYNPIDAFHLSVVMPSFDFNTVNKTVVHRMVEDKLSQFRCSLFDENRMAPMHLIQLEQALQAVFAGGYVFAVLPSNWQLQDMRYNRWLENSTGLVAKIRLPLGMVRYQRFVDVPYNVQDQYGSKVEAGWDKLAVNDAPLNDFSLYIFFKPLPASKEMETNSLECPDSGKYKKLLEWATMTHSPFLTSLQDGPLIGDNIEKLKADFEATEWYTLSVYQWVDMVRTVHGNCPLGLDHWRPVKLPDLSDMYMIEPKETAQQGIKIVDDLTVLRKRKYAVLIKPTRSRIKIIGYNSVSKALIDNLMVSLGFEEKRSVYAELLTKDFESIRHQLVSSLFEYGLVPHMLRDDAVALRTKMRRLNRELTPIQRCIPVETKNTSNEERSLGIEKTLRWEWLYADIGLRSSYPEQWAQWVRRAETINLNRPGITYNFQFDDIIVTCMKQSIVNASSVGLGKTRENLFAAILRGAKRILIIAPKKLIDTWKDEIEDTIVPWARRQKRNWNGELINVGLPNVIQYASDCEPDKLRLFNLISFDTLKSVPKDGTFYKCPKCGMVIYSAKIPDGEVVYCPGDPYDSDPNPAKDTSCVGEYRRWKAANRSRNEDGSLVYRKFKVWEITNEKVHWNENHPSRVKTVTDWDEDAQDYVETQRRILDVECKVVDTRKKNPFADGLTRSSPRRTAMKPQSHMYDKTQKRQFGTRTVDVTGADGNTVKVKEPVVRRVKRKCRGKHFHAKWTFAELLRWRFASVHVDEIITYANNLDSQRTQALYHLTAKHRVANTGTPMKGLPQKILVYINWTIPRMVFPEYRLGDPMGNARFLSRYRTNVIVSAASSNEDEDGEPKVVQGKAKQIHKIKNPHRFMMEIAPVMLRRVRGEPEVVCDIPDNEVIYRDLRCPMDDQHREYYEKFLEMFLEWYQAMKEETEGKVVMQNVLAKMGYLINASTNPHFHLRKLRDKAKKSRKNRLSGSRSNKADDIIERFLRMIPPYKGPPTAKMMKAMEILEDASLKKDKVLFGVGRQDTIDFGSALSNKKGFQTLTCDGRTSLETKRGQSRSKRHLLVQDFRNYAYDGMWCGLRALAEGMNIPEANHVVHYDTTWEPNDSAQFTGRVTRPAQTKTVFVYFLMHEGTMEEYMTCLCYLKKRSHSEGIDGQAFNDLQADMIPDIQQYIEAIIDGNEDVMKRQMWVQVEQMKRQWEVEGKQKMHQADIDGVDDDDEDDVDDD